MSKLYFRYGTVNSAKTLNLLAVAHNYDQTRAKTLVLKPEIDDRWGMGNIKTRAGLERKADYLISVASDFELFLTRQPSAPELACILVDEAQFLAPLHIDILRSFVAQRGVPAICYGLRCDFRGELFGGSKRLFEVADSIEEIKTVCNYCPKKAIMNLKLVDGKANLDGPSVELGGLEKYIPACWYCWRQELRRAEGAKNE